MMSKKLTEEKILEALLDHLEEGVHIVDGDGKTLYYNKTMEAIEGFTRDKVLGRRITEYLRDFTNEESTIMKALSTGDKIVNVMQRYDNKDSKEITTINTTVPIKDGEEVIGAIEISKDFSQLKKLNETISRLYSSEYRNDGSDVFDEIYGVSSKMIKAKEKARVASMSDASVLIYGETGTGKEIFSKSIHYGGNRKSKPFIPINCAAIPSALLEGILFGTEKGSFTGAEKKKGLFEAANYGTLLLDELNSMEPYLQSKLLRVIEDGYVMPLGSNKHIKVDVRIIATLNERPEILISEGRLRKDLFYRLSVFTINIPPLRERKEDIAVFIDKFIKYYNKILGKTIEGIEGPMLEKLTEYSWPGNVRELRNVVEFAMNMSNKDGLLTENNFDSGILYRSSNRTLESTEVGGSSIAYRGFNLKNHLEELEKKLVSEAFEKNSYNIKTTARELGISRQLLEYKIKKFNLTSKGE